MTSLPSASRYSTRSATIADATRRPRRSCDTASAPSWPSSRCSGRPRRSRRRPASAESARRRRRRRVGRHHRVVRARLVDLHRLAVEVRIREVVRRLPEVDQREVVLVRVLVDARAAADDLLELGHRADFAVERDHAARLHVHAGREQARRGHDDREARLGVDEAVELVDALAGRRP